MSSARVRERVNLQWRMQSGYNLSRACKFARSRPRWMVQNQEFGDGAGGCPQALLGTRSSFECIAGHDSSFCEALQWLRGAPLSSSDSGAPEPTLGREPCGCLEPRVHKSAAAAKVRCAPVACSAPGACSVPVASLPCCGGGDSVVLIALASRALLQHEMMPHGRHLASRVSAAAHPHS